MWAEPERLAPRMISRGDADGGPVLVMVDPPWRGPSVVVKPRGDGMIRVRFAEGPRFAQYRGILRCGLTRTGRIEVVNEVGMEEYLWGVVAAEMPGSFSPEALRAQAIAARTYALYLCRTGGRGRSWDVKAGEGSQVYGGVPQQADTRAAADAVEATRGVVCTWDTPRGRRIFCTYYSAACGGCTQPVSSIANDPVIPPLAGGVRCEYCRECQYYRWGPQRMPKSLVASRLRDRYARFAQLGTVEVVEPLDSTPDGRPTRIRVADANGRGGTLRAEEFRLAVDPGGRVLRSTHFRVVVEHDDLVFADGRGYGHGVGMCQWGAHGLARGGRCAGEILAFYYPGSRLSLAYR